MANYRPKSLDELNSLYDKSLNARNEIVKKASVLDAGNEKQESAFLPEESESPKEKTREQLAADEISGLVGDFVKSFGTAVPVKKVKPATVPTTGIKSVPKKAENNEQNNEAEVADNRPRLIRNTERNNLFENYKKVMDDEDDYDFAEPRKAKKKSKKLFDKKSTDNEGTAEEAAENESSSDSAAATEKKESKTSFTLAFPESEKEDLPAESFITLDEVEETTAEEASPAATKTSSTKAVVMALLLVFILLTTATGAVKAFSGINSNKLINEKYRIYTASESHTALGISKGDLVIVENKAVDEGHIVAYETSPFIYNFTKFNSLLNDKCFISDNGAGQKGVVYNNSIRGVLYKTVPVVGSIAAVIISDFTVVALVLLAVILLLALVAVFAFRKKAETSDSKEAEPEISSEENFYIGSDKESEEEISEEYEGYEESPEETAEEYSDEEYGYAEYEEAAQEEEEYEEEPEQTGRRKKSKRAKKEKKKRRSRKSRRNKSEEDEEEYYEDENEYGEEYEYDPYDADLSFLLDESDDEAYDDSYDDYRIVEEEEDKADSSQDYEAEDSQQNEEDKYVIADEEEKD